VYGQTGTGKTHTISCQKPGEEGIIPRALDYIFRKIEADEAHTYTVSMSYIQIYMEQVSDNCITLKKYLLICLCFLDFGLVE